MRINGKKWLALALALCLIAQSLPIGCVFAAEESLPQEEPAVAIQDIPWKAVAGENGSEVIDTTVKQYTFTFSTVPQSYEDIVQYELDSPYKTMALLILALRTWTPEDPDTCARMLDYLTSTGAYTNAGEPCPFSAYNPWTGFLKDRMLQNDKWEYIGNAYLKGASPENDYTPDEPITITLRESTYVPYSTENPWAPELYQVLISLEGADNERFCLFYEDDDGNWKVYSDEWKSLLVDVKPQASSYLWPAEYERPLDPANPQQEPEVTIEKAPALAPGVDENGNAVVLETTVDQYTFTFSTVPTCYEDILQYKLDSPYKTMALYFLALRTWTPENPTDCLQMLDYLTNTNVDSHLTDAQGHKLAQQFSTYNYWTSFVSDRMKQNTKYRYIGNAYLGGASPKNDYTPDEPITVTVRQSVYDAYSAATDTTPELKQILIHIDGADNDRYGLLYQDQRGDWRFWSDHWKGLLADVQTPYGDILIPPEYQVPENPAHPQVEPTVRVYDVPAKAPAVDDDGNSVVVDTTVKQYSFTFTTIPTCYEDIIQYKLDSPYKAMALLILAYRTWTPENRTDCLQMMDYLTNTAVDSGKTDSTGHKMSRKASEYQWWIDFVRDRMMQSNKWRYIGNAYLDGAMPANDYTPTEPITITVRQSVYDPYKPAGGHETDPSLYQVLTTIPGADNDRYAIFYQDQRGDYRVWSDNWKGLLTDIKTPTGDVPWPAEVVRSDTPANPQTEPEVEIAKIPAKASGVDEHGDPIIIDTEVDEYTFTFSTVPTCYEDIVQYSLDNPYKTMALYFLALRTWTPEHPEVCAKMLDYLTNTAVEKPGVKDGEGHQLCYGFSEYNPWLSFLKDRMDQNGKYRYIGNAYLNGASPSNNYQPSEPIRVTVRQSVYDPYKAKAETTPELKQVLVSLEGADNMRYGLLYQDQRGDWRFFGDNWQGLLSDVKEPESDKPWPAEVVHSDDPAHPQVEPAVKVVDIPAKAPDGEGGVMDTTVHQYTFTFSTVPESYEDIVQYKLDSPYKTMALLFLAFRTWTPENPQVCAEMLSYLTNPNTAKPGAVDEAGHLLSYAFSEYNPWIAELKDRMTANDKWKYIGNAYLKGSTPKNDYTPSQPITITVRESVYNPMAPATARSPEIQQVLVSLAGADNDRYSLFYQDQRGDWRVWSDNWRGLLVDVQESESDKLLPPEPAAAGGSALQAAVETRSIMKKAVNEEDEIVDVPVRAYSFTFAQAPKTSAELARYRRAYDEDGAAGAAALLVMALRTWTPEAPEVCLSMLDELTFTDADSGETDALGRKLAVRFSDYVPWRSFLAERMEQNDKYAYLGNSYLQGATPSNGYTPDEPFTVKVKDSVFAPYEKETPTTPELYQVFISSAGAGSDRYVLCYQDQRGYWRIWGMSWQNLLPDIQRKAVVVKNAAYDAVSGQVTFDAENAAGQSSPLVAVFDADGRFVGLNVAAQARDGSYVAPVEAEGSVRIFVPGDDDLSPAGEAVDLGD